MKRMLIVILSCFMILSLIGCGESSSTNSNLTSGKRIILSDDAPVCSSKKNVDKMIDYVKQNNSSGQQEMMDRGEATILPKGTEVNIVKSGIVVEIEIEDGTKWFAPFEAIKD